MPRSDFRVEYSARIDCNSIFFIDTLIYRLLKYARCGKRSLVMVNAFTAAKIKWSDAFIIYWHEYTTSRSQEIIAAGQSDFISAAVYYLVEFSTMFLRNLFYLLFIYLYDDEDYKDICENCLAFQLLYTYKSRRTYFISLQSTSPYLFHALIEQPSMRKASLSQCKQKCFDFRFMWAGSIWLPSSGFYSDYYKAPSRMSDFRLWFTVRFGSLRMTRSEMPFFRFILAVGAALRRREFLLL